MELLKELGLDEYESRAYLSLLEIGGSTVSRISESSEVPRGRIYGVLESLENKGLVRLIDRDPKRYEPVEPEKGLGSILNEREKEWKEKKQDIEQMIESLDSRNRPEPVKVLKTKENYYSTLNEMVEEAESEIRSIVGNLTAGRRTSIDEEAERFLADGGTHRILVSPEKADEEVIERLRKAGTEFREAELPELRFTVVDRERAVVAIDNPVLSYERFAVEIRGGEAPASLSRVFEKIWEESVEI